MRQNLDNAPGGDHTHQGIIFKKALGKYFVRVDGRVVDCSISNKLRKHLIYPTADPASIRPHVVAVDDIQTVDPVAVGDVVGFVEAGDGRGLITDILPRKSRLSRPALDGGRRLHKGSQPLEQVIVANLDQVVIVMPAANPAPHWELLDRYLAAVEAAGLAAVICLTKIDLMQDDALSEETRIYQQIGYPVILTSCVSGQGIDQIKAALAGRISVLWGKSGVGKTSLLNAIQPDLGLRVKEVNRHNGEGRHATTNLEMFDFDFGGSVVDTPGLRQFKMWNTDVADFAQLLPEMRPYIGQCRFGLDCTHIREPGCAIKAAVQAGHITARRYSSYLDMKDYFGV